MSPSERCARRAESELHKKGYKTMAMNPSEPKPCEPLAADGDRRRQPAAAPPRNALYCYSVNHTCRKIERYL